MVYYLQNLDNIIIHYVLLGGEAVTTPTFQLGSTGSTPGGDIFVKNSREKPRKNS